MVLARAQFLLPVTLTFDFLKEGVVLSGQILGFWWSRLLQALAH